MKGFKIATRIRIHDFQIQSDLTKPLRQAIRWDFLDRDLLYNYICFYCLFQYLVRHNMEMANTILISYSLCGVILKFFLYAWIHPINWNIKSIWCRRHFSWTLFIFITFKFETFFFDDTGVMHSEQTRVKNRSNIWTYFCL